MGLRGDVQGMDKLDVYIGYDAREELAYKVAEQTCKQHCSKAIVHKLDSDQLYQDNKLYRPVENHAGRSFDHLSRAYQATAFANSRFLIPYIHKTGWALFTDCDMVFLADVSELFELAKDKYALMCVNHNYEVVDDIKMDNQLNQPYARKNQSSVMLMNCDHPAWDRMNIQMMNYWPGLLLHRFSWLKDDEIGYIPGEWNWLVGVQDKPENPKIAHFTLGGPWFEGRAPQPYDEIWSKACQNLTE